MEYFTTTSSAARRAAQCVVVGVYEGGHPGRAATDLDAASGGSIREQLKQGDLSGKLGASRLLRGLTGVKAERVLVVGLGKRGEFGIAALRRALRSAADGLNGSKVRELVSYLSLEELPDADPYYLARYTVESVGSRLYRFTEMKSQKADGAAPLRKIGLAIAKPADATRALLGAEHADAIVGAMTLARDLGNLPANVCTPAFLARTAQDIAKKHRGVTTRVINEAEIRRLGMHSFLSVSSGTQQPPKLIVMQYKGAGRAQPVALVGKGITFDTGGISLKPGPGMDEMKFDMCGAASVIATVAAAAQLRLAMNVTAIVPTCENMPSGTATRPGDIVRSMSGQTIEVLNTDAEGRLILCDALTFARRFKPHTVIDVATLTGACVIALGHFRTAVMSPSDELARKITDAGTAADDLCWHMPMGEEYERQLCSNFADFANVGQREGGAIVAACFLGKFTKGMHWAHLDIAGTAWRSGARKGATGRPVPLLTEFLLRHAGALP